MLNAHMVQRQSVRENIDSTRSACRHEPVTVPVSAAMRYKPSTTTTGSSCHFDDSG